jgi:hypothetical protein
MFFKFSFVPKVGPLTCFYLFIQGLFNYAASSSEYVYSQMIRRLMNSEVEMVWKEAIMGLRKTTINLKQDN